MRLHNRAFDKKLRAAYLKSGGRLRQFEFGMLAMGAVVRTLLPLATALLPLLLVIAMSFESRVDWQVMRLPLFGLWSLALAVRGLICSIQYYKSLDRPDQYLVPVDAGDIARGVLRDFWWNVPMLLYENFVALAYIAAISDEEIPLATFGTVLLTLTLAQIGIAILGILLTKNGPFPMVLMMGATGVLLLIFFGGGGWVLGWFGAQQLLEPAAGLLVQGATWLNHVPPIGWVLQPYAQALEGSVQPSSWLLPATFAIAVIPLFWAAQLRTRALPIIRDRMTLFPDGPDDEEFEYDEEGPHSEEDEMLSVGLQFHPDLETVSASKLQEMASDGRLLERRGLGSTGWIEAWCEKLFNQRDRETLNAVVTLGEVRFTQMWFAGWKWLIAIAAVCVVVELIPPISDLSELLSFVLFLVLFFAQLPKSNGLDWTRVYSLPISPWAFESLNQKIIFVRTIAAAPTALAVAAFFAWINDYDLAVCCVGVITLLFVYAINAPFWTQGSAAAPVSITGKNLHHLQLFAHCGFWLFALPSAFAFAGIRVWICELILIGLALLGAGFRIVVNRMQYLANDIKHEP